MFSDSVGVDSATTRRHRVFLSPTPHSHAEQRANIFHSRARPASCKCASAPALSGRPSALAETPTPGRPSCTLINASGVRALRIQRSRCECDSDHLSISSKLRFYQQSTRTAILCPVASVSSLYCGAIQTHPDNLTVCKQQGHRGSEGVPEKIEGF